MTTVPPAKALRFGDLLRDYRLAAGLSQERLAEAARMSVTAVGALERGVRLAPYRATVDLLADALALDDAARAEFESAAERARARGRRENERPGPRHNLPPEQTSFVGRANDLARLRGLIARQRLRAITLTGPGGVGKSRLAVEAARELAGDFDDGVWLVQLAWIADPGLVENAIASALNVRGSGERPTIEALGLALRRRKLLLILDNCEHVLAAAAATVAALQSVSPGLTVVATSREPLGLPQELTYAVAPLELPPERVSSIDEALTFAAVELFARRAAALGAGVFDLSDRTYPAVMEIVRRLDGLPLAIELAAPKLRTADIDALAKGLHDRFALLVDARDRALPRHRALQALIEWSYETLSEDERHVFACCSIFAGPFTIDAAVAVAARDPLRDTAIYQAFTSLVTKSLIGAAGKTEQRYRLLETIREYARGRIDDAAHLESLRRKHAAHYLNVARLAKEQAAHATPFATLLRLTADRPNFEAALIWAQDERGDPFLAGQLCAALIPIFQNADMDFRRRLTTAYRDANPSEAPETFADLTLGMFALDPYTSEPERLMGDVERAVEIYRVEGDMDGLSYALGSKSSLHRRLGDFAAAREASTESVAIARTIGAPRRIAWALHHHGHTLTWDEPERAAAAFREALETYAPGEPDTLVSLTLSALAEIEYRSGCVEVARDLTKRAATLLEPAGDAYAFFRAVILGEYSAYALTLGEVAPAREAAREALRVELEFGMDTLTSFAIQHLALASALLGEVRRAALLLGYCIKATAGLLDINLGIDKDFRERALEIVRSNLSPDDVERSLRTGATWSEERAAEEAFRV